VHDVQGTLVAAGKLGSDAYGALGMLGKIDWNQDLFERCHGFSD